MLIVFCIIFSAASNGKEASSSLTVKLYNKPLSIFRFPTQDSTINSDFNFNLEPYITIVKNEINYRVTNNLSYAINNIALIGTLPNGITLGKSDAWNMNDCGTQETLNPGQSCLLRFYIDINEYMPTDGNDPLICISNNDCSWPSPEQQFNHAVELSPGPTYLQVTPEEKDGLSYDPATLSIIGKPTRAGMYTINVSAYNKYSTASPQPLVILVAFDPKDKPVFKDNVIIPSAMPDQDYQLNLMDLIESTPGLNITNQVRFRISESIEHPAWLSIDKEMQNILKGHVPISDAGQKVSLYIVASSNTGGDAYFKLIIPVASDPSQKPIIKNGIELTGQAGASFYEDIGHFVTDPANDRDNLKIIIDSVKPEAPWLSIYKTRFSGIIPEEALDQTYEIKLHANTAIGGDSDPETILLKVGVNQSKTPQFRVDAPKFPSLYMGQPYLYDFVANHDVYPDYNEIPYTVEFAEGHEHPDWLNIEDNKLVAVEVPYGDMRVERVYLTIKNILGGKSGVESFFLFVTD